MWHSHFFEASRRMSFFIGFFVAFAVGLTGIGGGSFTVPALVLIVGLTAGEAVGTAFVFAGVLRLVAAPFYLLGKRFHARYLWLLLLGAIPGLVLGTFVLRLLGEEGGNPVVVIVLGIVLAASSSVTFAPRVQNPAFAQKNSRWLPWLALPIGGEFHWKFGAINSPVLGQLLAGGVPGVLFGCALARHVPARKLKLVIAMIAVFAGVQLVWNGTRTLLANRAAAAVKVAARHE